MTAKRIGYQNEQVFNSTPNAPHNRVIATKQSPLLTNSIAFSINSPGQPSIALLGGRVDKLINEATNKINENSQVLRNTLDRESNIESSIER